MPLAGAPERGRRSAVNPADSTLAGIDFTDGPEMLLLINKRSARLTLRAGENDMRLTTYALTSGLVFGVVAFIHLLRIIQGWEITIVGMTIPLQLSWVAFAVSGIFAYYGIKLGLQKPPYR